MKVRQKTSKRNIWIIAAAIVAVILGLLLTYAVLAQSGNFALPGQTSNENNSTDKSNSEIENTTNEPNKITPPNSDKPAQTETNESTGKRSIPVVASATVDGSIVYIRGGLNTPETDGSCYAELSGPSNQKIKKDTTLLPSVSSTDCKTISIPISELSVGKWTYTLNFTSNSATGASNAETFNIN